MRKVCSIRQWQAGLQGSSCAQADMQSSMIALTCRHCAHGKLAGSDGAGCQASAQEEVDHGQEGQGHQEAHRADGSGSRFEGEQAQHAQADDCSTQRFVSTKSGGMGSCRLR